MYGRNRSGGGGRQVCPFFLEGRCKFGDNCKNEHPQDQSQNRFAPLQNPIGGRGRSGAFGQGQQAPVEETYSVSADGIKIDLTTERPIWPLSVYGPGRNAPAQLIEGELERSPEEMRVLYYMTMAAGGQQEAIAQEAQAAAKANEAVQAVLRDLNGAVKFVIEGKDRHPNRFDIERSSTQPAPSSSAVGAAPAAPTPSPFGQSSTIGQTTSAFGQSSAAGQATPPFGQATAPGFGQPSTFGKPTQPGFGQASSLGGATPSPFGRPSALGGQGSTFGQPAHIGAKPAFGQATFGQPARPAFGQVSTPAFGQPAPTNAFGGGSPFGQAQTQERNPTPFAAAANQPSAFAQAAQQSTGFGQPSAFGANAAQASPFATAGQTQPQQPVSNPFGSNATSAPGPFGQPAAQPQASPFGQAPAKPTPAFGQPTASAFGQPSTAPAAAPAFGQPTQATPASFGHRSTAQAANPLSAAQPSPFAQAPQRPSQQPLQQSQPQPAQSNDSPAVSIPSTSLTLSPSGVPTHYKSQPLRHDQRSNAFFYTLPNRQEERLWFPQGAPERQNPDTVLGDAWYTGDLGRDVQDIYVKALASGIFECEMPEVPPRREWIGWDL